ncbi:MAG: response regulator [Candidatus Omnitrophica bacterium]|nr:response regulator [Candidatus Omnitrophota bacterium]
MDKKKILIVEDSPTMRDMVSYRLQASGYETETASCGEEALKKIKELKPDLVLLDVKMPGMNGFEVCQRSKSDPETKAVPIIFLTTAAQESDIIKGKELGADGYLTKPYDGKELIKEIGRILN